MSILQMMCFVAYTLMMVLNAIELEAFLAGTESALAANILTARILCMEGLMFSFVMNVVTV